MKQINIKGDIISNDEAWIYEYLKMEAVSPKMVINALPSNNKPIKIIINSGGGSVFAGYEIYNTLRTYKGNVIVEIHGLAASIASVIAMAGDIVKMSPLSQIMIHNASTSARGDYRTMDYNSEVLKKTNITISKAYALKSGKSESYFLELMNKESWITSDEALEIGLIDEIMYQDISKRDKEKLKAQLNLLKLKRKCV